jgi:hypothetical protein
MDNGGKVTIRVVQWQAAIFRPVAMPSVVCPIVRDWQSGDVKPDWMGINHCNACAFIHELHINYLAGTGEVYCAAK